MTDSGWLFCGSLAKLKPTEDGEAKTSCLEDLPPYGARAAAWFMAPYTASA